MSLRRHLSAIARIESQISTTSAPCCPAIRGTSQQPQAVSAFRPQSSLLRQVAALATPLRGVASIRPSRSIFISVRMNDEMLIDKLSASQRPQRHQPSAHHLRHDDGVSDEPRAARYPGTVARFIASAGLHIYCDFDTVVIISFDCHSGRLL